MKMTEEQAALARHYEVVWGSYALVMVTSPDGEQRVEKVLSPQDIPALTGYMSELPPDWGPTVLAKLLAPKLDAVLDEIVRPRARATHGEYAALESICFEKGTRLAARYTAKEAAC